MTRLTSTFTENQLTEELRTTLNETGWNTSDTQLVIDTTAERLSNGSDSAAESLRHRLRAIWQGRFEIQWVG